MAIKKDFDVVNSEPPGHDSGETMYQYKGTQPRSGDAKMDGGTNEEKPFDPGSYKGKKDFDTLTSKG
jgi:hypothetical protein